MVFIFLFVHFYAPNGLCVLIVATKSVQLTRIFMLTGFLPFMFFHFALIYFIFSHFEHGDFTPTFASEVFRMIQPPDASYKRVIKTCEGVWRLFNVCGFKAVFK